MVSGTRNLQTRVKELSRQYRAACKPKKVKKHTVMHDPMNISAELLKYLKKQSGGPQMTKSEAMKMVSTRVKTTVYRMLKIRDNLLPIKHSEKSSICPQSRLLHLLN